MVTVTLESPDGDEVMRRCTSERSCEMYVNAMGHQHRAAADRFGDRGGRRQDQIDPTIEELPAELAEQVSRPGSRLVSQLEEVAGLDHGPAGQGACAHRGCGGVRQVGVQQIEVAGQTGETRDRPGQVGAGQGQRVDRHAVLLQGPVQALAARFARHLRIHTGASQTASESDDVSFGPGEAG